MKYVRDYGYTKVKGIEQDFQAHINAGGFRAQFAGGDFATPRGTPILADMDGYATMYTDSSNNNEKGVILVNGNTRLEYVHFGRHKGQSRFVKKGDIIGYAGDSGWAEGVHTHVAAIVDGVRVDPINYLNTTMDHYVISIERPSDNKVFAYPYSENRDSDREPLQFWSFYMENLIPGWKVRLKKNNRTHRVDETKLLDSNKAIDKLQKIKDIILSED